MGSIKRFDLDKLIEDFQLENYVETGFGDCTSFNYALQSVFKKHYGVDLDSEFYLRASKYIEQYNNEKEVYLFNQYSSEFLKEQINNIKGNTLWFLDAHFAGNSDYGKCSYEDSIRIYKELTLPLETELEIITSNRDISNDVIIIDDVFLYIGDHLTAWSRENPFKYRELINEFKINLNPDFIYKFLEKTHKITVDTQDQGYIVAIPKIRE